MSVARAVIVLLVVVACAPRAKAPDAALADFGEACDCATSAAEQQVEDALTALVGPRATTRLKTVDSCATDLAGLPRLSEPAPRPTGNELQPLSQLVAMGGGEAIPCGGSASGALTAELEARLWLLRRARLTAFEAAQTCHSIALGAALHGTLDESREREGGLVADASAAAERADYAYARISGVLVAAEAMVARPVEAGAIAAWLARVRTAGVDGQLATGERAWRTADALAKRLDSRIALAPIGPAIVGRPSFIPDVEALATAATLPAEPATLRLLEALSRRDLGAVVLAAAPLHDERSSARRLLALRPVADGSADLALAGARDLVPFFTPLGEALAELAEILDTR